MSELNSDRLEFWNDRSLMGWAAGSNDVNLKRIEVNAIASLIPESGSILDAGCGNAWTILELASKRTGAKFVGFDYSEGMVVEGRKLLEDRRLNN